MNGHARAYLEAHHEAFLMIVCCYLLFICSHLLITHYKVLGASRGLDYLHSCVPHIVHGDIRGANILVNDSGGAVLCDFGLARIRHEVTRTNTGIIEGGYYRSAILNCPRLSLLRRQYLQAHGARTHSGL